MIITKIRSICTHNIRWNVVGVITPIRLVRRSIIILKRTRSTISAFLARDSCLSRTNSFICKVSCKFEHILYRLKIKGRRRYHVKFVVLLESIAIFKGAIHTRCTIECQCTILIIWSINRLSPVLELAKKWLRSTRNHRLMILAFENSSIVAEFQPISNLYRTFSS